MKRGLHSLAAKDGNGALRPKTDEAGALVGLQWGAGLVVPIAPAAVSGGAAVSSRPSWPRSKR
ncbi:putative transposase [Mycobacterium xenopi 4042]|uniref:Putative transposase n=1 Tax=Mycobacterium xenopi 4042 TaxID=1299334 RepID=X8DCD6_MYCXE|nr:putative transposase [Mycobacterium xenopi 4042]